MLAVITGIKHTQLTCLSSFLFKLLYILFIYILPLSQLIILPTKICILVTHFMNTIFMEENLPPGFRFHPTDEELITYYLSSMIADRGFTCRAIAVVDLNKCEPWDLPGT